MRSYPHQAELDSCGYVISHNTNFNWRMDSYHFHEFFEVNLILSGVVNFFVADQVYSVQRGTLLVLGDQDLHRSVSAPDTPYERYVLYFSPKYVENLSTVRTDLLECFVNQRTAAAHSVQLTDDQIAAFLVLLKKAEGYCHDQGYGSDLHQQTALIEILLFVNQLFRSAAALRKAHTATESQRVLPVIDFIQTHLADDLSLDRLSAALYINKYHLGHLFRQATGFTVNEYIIHRRILRARELLKSRVSVQQVAEEVGFNNVSHFIRTFKRLVGITPKQYQLGLRNEG